MREKDDDSSEGENLDDNFEEKEYNISTSQKKEEKNETQKQTELQNLDDDHKKSFDDTVKSIKDKIPKQIHNSYLYNIKDYIFFFFLMICSSINFSYLYLPLIFIGIIFYLFLIRNNSYASKKAKFVFEIISFIYSLLLIIFKIVCLVLIKKNNSFIIKDHKNLFLDLGVCYLRDQDSFFYFLMTFLGEGIVIFFSIYCILISTFCRDFEDRNDTSLMENNFWTVRNLLMLNFIFILSLAVFNVSYLTLFYMVFIQFIFFLDSLTNIRTKFRGFFKFICILFMALILTQVAAINVLNIPKFQEEILHKHDNIGKTKYYKVYSLWTQIGIYYAYHKEIAIVLKEWAGYLAAICSLLTLTFSLNKINVNELAQRRKLVNINLRTAKTILKQRKEDLEKKGPQNSKLNKIKTIFSNIIDEIKAIIQKVVNFITSPTFIIQFSRIMSIAWLYFYRNFYSLGIFISLFFSFLFVSTKSNKYLTIFLLMPMVFVSLICFHYSNIDGLFEDYDEVKRVKYLHFGLGKYEYSFCEYYFCNIFYIFIMFLIYSFYNSTQDEEKKENINIVEEDQLENPLLGINASSSNDQPKENKKIEIILDTGEIQKEKKEERKKIQDLSFINIILKTIFSNIDKITLIVMYFVAVKSINIIHLILVIIFLIQILLPNKIQNLFEIILCLLQFLFLFELCVDLLKVYYLKEFNENKDFMNFLMTYSEGLSDNNLEIIIYAVVYCFFFQYQIYNFPFLKRLIENKELTLGNYVDVKFGRFERIKNILFVIGNIILELYIWILIGLFTFISCYFEINLLFAIKLAWFLALTYNFLKKIQNPDNGTEYSRCWQGLFLFYCCINTLAVYLYQFISDEYIHLYDDVLNSTNFFIINLPNIGFTMYNRDDLYYNFVPYFCIIFISVLFITETRSQLDKLSKDNKNKANIIKQNNKVEDEIDLKLKNPKLTEEEKELLKAKKFEKNKNILFNLSIRYFLVNILKIITKFYWLLLFLAVGLIFCFYDLSYSMSIYMIIFGITFIFMFVKLIKKMTEYIRRPSYFISKVIRCTLVEVPRHIQQNKLFRSIAFRYLLSYSFVFFILLYLYGVFELFQNGCNKKFFRGCEERNKPIFENGSDTETYIKAFSYLFGIYVNIREEGLMNVAWIHILLSALIGFDVYAQKLENKFTDSSEDIKANMQRLSNENSSLFHFILMADTNILIKLGLDLAGVNENDQKKLRDSFIKIRTKSLISEGRTKSIQEQQEIEEINSVNTNENLEENQFLKNERIKSLIKIISKANDNQQTLSYSNNSTKLLFFIKKFFEEIIIFLLICIALTKLNVLSFFYLIYSAYLVKTSKTMMKLYVLYSFLLVLIIIQSAIYISNISENTCPRPNEYMLGILKSKLKIPWFKIRLNLEDKYAFFFGFGVNSLQINLILLEYALVIVIYIYLDFFSYSIYQDVRNKGETKISVDKFNFAGIKMTNSMKTQILNMNESTFNQYRDCLRHNFHLDIGENLQEFLIKLDLKKHRMHRENNNLEDNNDNNNNVQKFENEELNKLILYRTRFFERREINRREGTDNIPESSYAKTFQEIIYLYLHHFILFLVITLSLMITGMISIFYIIICFIYLINADRIYLAKIYGYPIAINKILKICIICDIVLQIIYQIPYLSPDQNSVIQKIFDVLGLIKLIDYEAKDENSDETEIKLISNGIAEVIGKPLIYFFLSLQVIIYNSKYFKNYYLTFLLNRQFEINKNSLINSFRFNNERIEAFKSSTDLRLKSEKAMEKLKITLEDWNEKLKIGGGFLGESEGEKKKGKKEDIKEDKKEDKKKEEEKEEEENEINTKLKKEKKENNFGVEEKDGKKRRIVEPDKIKEKITNILLGGIITKFYLWFNRHSIYYKSMEENKIKRTYEKNCILGKLEMKNFIEDELEQQLNILDLSDFDVEEVDLLEDLVLKCKKGKIQKDIEKFRKQINDLKMNEIKKQVNKDNAMNENNIDNNNINNNLNTNTVIIDEENYNKIIIDFPIKKINVNCRKFKQFIPLLDTKLFSTYLKTSYQIKSILLKLEDFLSYNFDYFCYFVMIIDHMINASLLTMFLPISIFCYGLLENPRPSKNYWQICIYYTIFVLCLKFFFQLKLFNYIFNQDDYIKFLDTLYNYKIGIRYFEVSFGTEFFKYIIFDTIVLIVLAINRNLLISNGLWEKREEEVENIFTANERIQVNKDRVFNSRREEFQLIKDFIFYKPKQTEKTDIKTQDKNNINIIEDDEKEKLIKRENKKDKVENKIQTKKLKFNKGQFEPKYDEGKRKFFEKLFPKVRNEKPGDDFYPFYSSVLALISIYILFFFTAMDQDKTYGPVNLDTTQFSGNMVLFLLLHIVILVYDRAIYICQNKNHLKFRYFIYKKNEKGEGEIISKEEYKDLKQKINPPKEDKDKDKDNDNINNINKEENKDENQDEDINDNKDENKGENKDKKKQKKKNLFIPLTKFDELYSQNYNLFYVQTELFNKPLMHKYIMHIFSTIICHIMIFFYFPMKGNYNLLNTIYCIKGELCNDFNNNGFIIFFYLIYLIYLYLSSIQIRHGYFDIKRKSLFKNNTTVTNIFSKVFNAIPFLPNIRNTVDWTFTSTCLDLFSWNKFESIYDTIFDAYCDADGNDDNKIGEKVGKKKKILMGGLLSFALIFIVVIPLILFSSLNPTNKLNNLTGAKLNVDLAFTYENEVEVEYNIYENERAKAIIDMNDEVWEKYNYSKSVQTRNFNKKQIQIVLFYDTSDRNWDLAEPHIKDLIDLLNITKKNGISKIDLNIQTEFKRPLPKDSQTVSMSYNVPLYDSSDDSNDGEDSEEISKALKLMKAIAECEDTDIEFEQVYSPALRITAGEEVTVIEDEKYIKMKDVRLGFRGCKIETVFNVNETYEEISYSKSFFTFESKDADENWIGLEFHVFNDKISETTSGYSVLTFYLTFILVVGSYVQEFLASEPEKIMFTDLPHPESIVNLCEGIQISRYSYDFKKEEYLFTILIELMRSPDYLKLLTLSSIDQFNIRKNNTASADDEENEEENKEDDKGDDKGDNNDDNNNDHNDNDDNNNKKNKNKNKDKDKDNDDDDEDSYESEGNENINKIEDAQENINKNELLKEDEKEEDNNEDNNIDNNIMNENENNKIE